MTTTQIVSQRTFTLKTPGQLERETHRHNTQSTPRDTDIAICVNYVAHNHGVIYTYIVTYIYISIYIYTGIADLFQTKDVQTPPFSFDLVLMKDAQCAETNEKSTYRFLFSEEWVICSQNY